MKKEDAIKAKDIMNKMPEILANKEKLAQEIEKDTPVIISLAYHTQSSGAAAYSLTFDDLYGKKIKDFIENIVKEQERVADAEIEQL